jgi:hypothetical protein
VLSIPRPSIPRPPRARLLQQRLLRLSLLALCLACSCKPTPQAAEADAAFEQGSGSEALEFSFPGGEDLVVSSATTRGRVTALAFVATYDMASQLLLRRLADVIVHFTPRVNAAAVVVEAPRYADLLPAYRDSLQLPFPVVMVDFATQQGQGPFASIQRVPTLVVLDKAGREVSRRQGALDAEQIEAELRDAAQRRP